MQVNGHKRLAKTRRSLLSRLKNWSDEESWKAFFDRYWGMIYNLSIRTGLSAVEAEDVVQETVITVLKELPGAGAWTEKRSFRQWLKVRTLWRIRDQIRKRKRGFEHEVHEPRTSTRTDTVERQPDPAIPDFEKAWDEEWENHLTETAIERVKHKVDPKDYQIFDACVFKEWPVSKVSEQLGVRTARVYLAKHRVARLIKKEMRYLLSKPV